MLKTHPLCCLLLALFFASKLAAQLNGKVLDESGEPLPFASVYVQNSTIGTTANADGEFRLALQNGTYRIVFQYIGYRQKIETVTIGGTRPPERMTVRMEPTDLRISEVVISANAEDPAYAIMRQAIARRKFHKKQLADWSCDAYVKGLYQMLDAPKKLLGKEVGDFGGALDSTRAGIIYLSESVSKLYAQAAPARKKEVMISSKVSGDPNGFSLNRATLTDFSLYDERLEIEREILSPLADNAFSYYRFRLLGKFKDQNGFEISKIEVIPKRSEDPVLAGFLYVVEEKWNLQGADLVLTGGSIQQPVLDTLRITQEFVPLGKDEKWALLSQVTAFKFGIFGFKIRGFYNSVFSNYALDPAYGEGFFTREIFKIEQGASERDSAYWEKIRPVPLTAAENRDYVKKDSLHVITESKAYKDSLDRKNNRPGFGDLLGGYTWRNSYKRFSVSVPGALQWFQFNTVQGGVLSVEPGLRKRSDERGTRFWEADLRLNYGFSEKRFRSDFKIRRRFESIRYRTLEISGGLKTEQFNPARPILPLINTAYSLIAGRNYMKVYEKAFARADWSQEVFGGIFLSGGLEFADRRLLQNHSDYSWHDDAANRYTENDPIDAKGNEGILQGGKAFFVDLALRFRFGQNYLSYPDFRVFEDSKWPDLTLRYRKAVPGIGGSTADFDVFQAQIQQNDLSAGIVGRTEWRLVGGFFARKKNLLFLDHRHFLGEQRINGNPDDYSRGFFMLPFYSFSTDRPYVQAHVQHHFNGFLLDKIPGVRKLNWKEVLGFNFMHASGHVLSGENQGRLPYFEADFGLENIGWKAFRMLRLDVVSGFYRGKYERAEFVIGLGF